MKTKQDILTSLKKADIQSKTFTSNPDELVHIAFEMYPTEVVSAAQKALGDNVLSHYFVEIYEFAVAAQTHNSQVKKAQLNGILLTHNKITKWLEKCSIEDVFALEDPSVMKIYLRHHISAMKRAVDMFEIIAQSITQ